MKNEERKTIYKKKKIIKNSYIIISKTKMEK